AWTVGRSPGAVARTSMSQRLSTDCASAAFSAVSARATSGISAQRVTFEKPTPLMATLHRFSHIWRFLLLGPHGSEAKLRQRDLVVQFLENHLDPPPDFHVGVYSVQEIASH